MPRAVIVTNADSFFVSHRLAIGTALRDHGFEVVVAAGESDARAVIERAGLRFQPVPFDRGGRSVRRDARTLTALVALYRRERPDVVHHVTIKPVLYGSLAARAAGVNAVINAVSGLGYVFIDRDRPSRRHAALRHAVGVAYRLALDSPRTRTIFQNPDDRKMFVDRGLVSEARTVLIRGSGVDTQRFSPRALPVGTPIVVLPARMLWDKGVGEFVEAARTLRAEGVHARFVLVGGVDSGNPAGVPEGTLAAWVRGGLVEWWGHRTDMPEVLAQSSLVVLPSYREGMPLALAEATAAGRACIAADVPGCREVVRAGFNGWLVPARDPRALTDAMREALADASVLESRGANGRELAVAELSQDRVLRATLAVYDELLAGRHRA
jgi:glycosyltransferase involved in cell wall biosynthesis